MPRSKKTWQPRHIVDVRLQAQDIAKLGAAITFSVKSDEGKLGTIQIGQGGFQYRARNGKRFKRISWRNFFDRLEKA